MDWFRLIFRFFKAYFACYKAIALLYMPGCLCVEFCGCFSVKIQKSNLNLKKTPEVLKKVGMERVNEYVATYEHRVELKCVILHSLGRENV